MNHDRPTISCWAPGRVNLVGEHIDYCGGAVLPMPIQYGTRVTVTARDDTRVRAASTLADSVEFTFDDHPDFAAGHWGRYVHGAVELLRPHGVARGADIAVSGDIPGSGLSSSASLTVGLVFALAELNGIGLTRLNVARIAQRVEHDEESEQHRILEVEEAHPPRWPAAIEEAVVQGDRPVR